MESLTKKKTSLRMTKHQKERLVDLVEADFSTCVGRFKTANGRKTKQNIWNHFANELNSLGPPYKNGEQWKKSFEYVQCRAKKKVGGLRKQTNTKIDLDTKLVKMFGKNHFDGQQNLNEIGFSNRRIEPIIELKSVQDKPGIQNHDENEILEIRSVHQSNTIENESACSNLEVSNRPTSTTIEQLPSIRSSPRPQGLRKSTSKNVERPDLSGVGSKTLAERLSDIRERYKRKRQQNAEDVKRERNRFTGYEMLQQSLSLQREFLEQYSRQQGETTIVLHALTAAVDKLATSKN